MKIKLICTVEFEDWFQELTPKEQAQVTKRLSLVQEEAHFGDHKSVGDHVWEMRWVNGRRLYYAFIPPSQVLLLLGGNKNGQDKDIRRAKKVLGSYTSLEN
jgi:putative addiction module killer protein